MKCYLGIDLGTSTVKAIVVDESGAVLAIRERGYPIHHPRPGLAEQVPDEWWEATAECLRDLIAAREVKGCSIEAIGLSGQMHGLVMLDKSGAPLRNAIIWTDTRTAEICAEWSRSGSAEAFHSITGLPLASGFFAPSLEWVRREEPDICRRTAVAILPKDYIRFKLTGKIATDPSDASGTCLFDIGRRDWAPSVLKTFRLDEKILPELAETLSPAGTVTLNLPRFDGHRVKHLDRTWRRKR